MPANLTLQYKEAEERFRQATSHDEKLVALRELIALLPKHKGTEKLHADLKRRLARLEEEGQQSHRGGGKRQDPAHVHREGAGQWVLLGAPNAGKSALLRALTHAHPAVAAYPFTTHEPMPGMMDFEDIQVQLVDTPAVARDHTPPWLANLAQGADGLLLIVDVAADDLEVSWAALAGFLEKARIRPASRPRPPDGEGPGLVRPVLVLANKRDLDEDGTYAALARETIGPELPFFRLSAVTGDGIEALRPALFRELRRIRVYTKEPSHKLVQTRPFVLPDGATVHDLALAIHHDIADRLKFARMWGPHARFDGQQVDRGHRLADRDVVELHV